MAPDGTIRSAEYPVIITVSEDSPAQKAGLAVGDLILLVNGRDGREAGVLSFKGPGQIVAIRVQRADEVRDYTFVTAAFMIRK